MVSKCFIICPNPSIDIYAHLETFNPGMSHRITEEKRYPGGKGVHVAMALAEMKIPSTLIGIWGEDNGDVLKRSCQAYYPDLEITGPSVTGSNRSCYTFLSDEVWDQTELLGMGPGISESEFTSITQLIIERESEISCLAVCGSWPTGAHDDYNYRLNVLAKKIGVPLFVDCTGPQLTKVLDGNPYCVHLNYHEVTELYNKPFLEAMELVKKSCTVAAITHGAKGLYYYQDGKMIHANVLLDNVYSTVGSGDCLLAGIIAGHYLKMNDLDIAKLGVACGAANCLNKDLGMLKQSDVNLLNKKVVTAILKNQLAIS